MDKKTELLELQHAFAGLSATPTHKLVEATKKQLRNAKADDKGILMTQTKRCLDVRVSRSCLDRALDLLNAIFFVLEQRGLIIEIREENPRRARTFLKFGGDAVQIHIEEDIIRTSHILTDEERKKLARKEAQSKSNYRYGYDSGLYWWKPPEWDYNPSGRLQLQIDNLESSGQRQIWSDSTRRQLESLLPSIAYGIIQAAVYLRKRTLERQDQERRWTDEAKQRAERERQQLEEQGKADHLDALMKRWSRSEQILQFLSWVDDIVPSEERTEAFLQWYEWAKGYAQRLSPLTNKDFYKSEQPRYRY